MWMKMYNPFYDHPGCKWFINILTNMMCNSPILRHIPLIKVKTTTYNHHLASGINRPSLVQKKYPKLLTIISIHFHYRTFHQCTPNQDTLEKTGWKDDCFLLRLFGSFQGGNREFPRCSYDHPSSNLWNIFRFVKGPTPSFSPRNRAATWQQIIWEGFESTMKHGGSSFCRHGIPVEKISWIIQHDWIIWVSFLLCRLLSGPFKTTDVG